MPDVPTPNAVEQARGRWRADLLRYHESELRRLAGDDPSPAAATILADADSKAAEAELHDVFATLDEEFAAAKAACRADPKNERLYRKYNDLSHEITDMRSTWRGIGEAVGNRRFVQSVDNFPEPSDEDVLASHGGNA